MSQFFRSEEHTSELHFSSVQLLSRVRLFATPWTATHQASLSITNFWSFLKLMSNESVMPSNPLILCRSLLLLFSTFPNIRVFSNESVLRIRWPKYWSFSFNISPSKETVLFSSSKIPVIPAYFHFSFFPDDWVINQPNSFLR